MANANHHLLDSDTIDILSEDDDFLIEGSRVVPVKVQERNTIYQCSECHCVYKTQAWLNKHKELRHRHQDVVNLRTSMSDDDVKLIIDATVMKLRGNALLSSSPHMVTIQRWLLSSVCLAEVKSLAQSALTIHSTSKTPCQDLHTLSIPSLSRITSNYITQVMIPEILRHNGGSQPTNEVHPGFATRIQLSMEEQQAIYYVGGYVIRSLMNQFRSQCDVIEALEAVLVETPPAFCGDWTLLQSRGGLVFINSDMHDVFCTMEKAAISMLTNANLGNSYLLSFLTDGLSSIDSVSHSCAAVFVNGFDIIFPRLIRRFSETRCRAYVKRLNKLYIPVQSTKSSASLRQHLRLQ